MNQAKQRLAILSEEKISKALLKLGIPTMVGMLVSALYNVVDAFWVGMLGIVPLAAVTVIYPLTMVGMGIGMLFGTGANSNIARLLGSREYAQVRIYSATTIFSSVATIVIIVALMLFNLDDVLRFLGASTESMDYARGYGSIFIAGLVVNVYDMTMNNILVAEGNAARSMRAMLMAGLANIVLDPLFIFIFQGGVEGAAYATLVARLLAAGMYTAYILRGDSYLSISLSDFKMSVSLYKNIFKIGIPFLFFQLLNGASVALTNVAAYPFGTAAIAAMGIVNRIMSMASNTLIGFIKGYGPLVGYNHGAGKEERVELATRTAIRWSTMALVIFGGLCIVFSQSIIALFTQDKGAVLEIGSMALVIVAISIMPMGIQAVINNYFLAMGKAREGFILSVFFQGAFYIPLLFLMRSIWGLNGIIWAPLPAEILGTVMAVYLWRIDRKAAVKLKDAGISY